jgi:DNA invertase Pin-like site-specific DNA recombinase
MIGIYIRVSTVGQNAAGQKREIRRWLKGNGIDEKEVEWYVDKATGNNLDRPELERLQRDIFNGEIETVVVWKLDRLSRNLRDGINTLADWCDKGLRVVSVTQQIDFNGALGKMLAAVLLGVAEMEQETRKERQAAGIAAAKERGDVYNGRKAGTTKAKPKRALELRNKGLNDAEISTAMGISRRTVQRYLNNG